MLVTICQIIPNLQCCVAEQGKQSQPDSSESQQHPAGEEADDSIQKQEEDEESFQNNPPELEHMEQEQEVRGTLLVEGKRE